MVRYLKKVFSFKLEIIKVVWSPYMSLIEKRRNHNDLCNMKLDPHDRAVTFEGLDYMS